MSGSSFRNNHEPDQKDVRIQCFDQMESPLLHYAMGFFEMMMPKTLFRRLSYGSSESMARYAMPRHGFTEPLGIYASMLCENAEGWFIRLTKSSWIFLSVVESEENQDPVRE